MSYIINPYNVVAFYEEPFEHHWDAPLYSPHDRMPPFQLYLDTSETSGTTTFEIVDERLLYVQDLFGVAEQNVSGDKTYVTYRAASKLSPHVSEGKYRIKITTNDRVLWSHAIYNEEPYQTFDFQLITLPSALSGGGCEFSTSVFTFDPDMEKSMEFDYGNGIYQYAGASSGVFTTENITTVGAYSARIRQNVFYPDGAKFYKEYTLSGNTSGCGGSALSTPTVGGYNYHNWCYLEWTNTKDLQGLNLYYQSFYEQRLYFHTSFNYPQPIVEENFFANGENLQVLQNMALSEQVQFDIWPVPDYILQVLQSTRAHDEVKLVVCADGKETEIKNFSPTRRLQDGENSMIIQCTGEINRAFINGCQENEVTV